MAIYNQNYSQELNDALTYWDDYYNRKITINQYHPASVNAALKIKSNQKYSNFDLATWEPWMVYGLKHAYDRDNDCYLTQKEFEDKVNEDITSFYDESDSELDIEDINEDINNGTLVPGTTPLSVWGPNSGCDDTWYDTTKVFPKNYKIYGFSDGGDGQEFNCYDVTIIVDTDTDEIVWMTTHSD